MRWCRQPDRAGIVPPGCRRPPSCCRALPPVGVLGIPGTTTRLKLTVSYDGAAFAGFQWQKGKVRTVQGELERAAARIFHTDSRVVGASRTDGGAHAMGQVAHLDVFGDRQDPAQLETDVMYMNAVLPDDLKIVAVEPAPADFDCHFSSLGKEYHYLLSSGLPNPLQAKQRWWVHDRYCERARGKPTRLRDIALDVGAMQAAAAKLVGTHDFSAFMDTRRPAGLGSQKRKRPNLAARGIKPVRTPEKNTRTLWRAEVAAELAAAGGGGSGLVRLEVEGTGFLYRMVRLLAAALVEVGQGRLTPDQLAAVLAAGKRDALPEAAPPHGLYLMQVHYEVPPGVPEELREAVVQGQQRKLGRWAPGGRGCGGDGGEGAAGGSESDEEG